MVRKSHLSKRGNTNKYFCSEIGAQVAFLPEAFDFIGESAKETNELAENLNDSDGTISFYKSLAKELRMALSLGGFHEKLPNSKIGNTHVSIDLFKN